MLDEITGDGVITFVRVSRTMRKSREARGERKECKRESRRRNKSSFREKLVLSIH